MNAQIFTLDELIQYMKDFNWTREIKQLHIHHTWKPDYSDFNGENSLQLQQGMRNYHVDELGWQDIGQHLTLLPDGNFITGRDFNIDPASISGWNTGAFAVEMVGNFDIGNDVITSEQAESLLEFSAFFAVFKVLNVNTDLKFHRDNPTAGKTCPGTGISKEWYLDGVLERVDKYLPKPNPDAWKYEALKELNAEGLVTDYQGWADKINEPLPAWAGFIILNRIYKKLKEE